MFLVIKSYEKLRISIFYEGGEKMTKLQKYDALLAKAHAFGGLGILLGVVVVVCAPVVNGLIQSDLVVLSVVAVWMLLALAVIAVLLCLVSAWFRIASVKLMRKIVDEAKNRL